MKKFIFPILLAILIMGGIAYTVYYVNKKPVGQIFVATATDIEIKEEDIPGLQPLADQGDKLAQYKLALAYSIGKGVAQDYVQAANWAQKSAEQGFARAQTFLGVMYMKGEGVANDDETAYMWLLLAAAQSDGQAQTALKMYQKILPKEEIESAAKRADEWRQQHG